MTVRRREVIFLCPNLSRECCSVASSEACLGSGNRFRQGECQEIAKNTKLASTPNKVRHRPTLGRTSHFPAFFPPFPDKMAPKLRMRHLQLGSGIDLVWSSTALCLFSSHSPFGTTQGQQGLSLAVSGRRVSTETV